MKFGEKAEVKIRGQRRVLEDVLKRLDEIFLVTRTSRIIDHLEDEESHVFVTILGERHR